MDSSDGGEFAGLNWPCMCMPCVRGRGVVACALEGCVVCSRLTRWQMASGGALSLSLSLAGGIEERSGVQMYTNPNPAALPQIAHPLR
jgi:hypothetical protein